MPKVLENVKIEKLVFGGQALGHTPEGKTAFVWNALPGETVSVEVTKEKKNMLEGIATTITSPVSQRIQPRESHYLSSSPWQILNWEEEMHWKQVIAQETYHGIGHVNPPNLKIIGDEKNQFAYRNKMEFSFTLDEKGKISLAFFARGQKKKIPISSSQLAYPWINHVAAVFVDWVQKMKLTPRELKSLILRGNQDGKVIAGLFIKDPLEFDTYPDLTDALQGYQIFYSTHKSPASVPTKLLYEKGDLMLNETIQDTILQYGLFSFFQVNIPLFELALQDIATFVKPKSNIIDLYSGVGAIGLSFAKKVKSGVLIDNVPEAIDFAQKNIQLNNAENFSATCLPAEKVLDLITQESTVIVDPPRSGLHPKVTERIMSTQPSRVIYLSCNISTQARDLELLLQKYTLKFCRLYNFFPRTPHIEGLCFLEKK
jgi:23S rRNA (uracil1939-C5)-methyltransferase